MSRRIAIGASLLAVIILCLPAFAAAKRARAQGTYAFRLVGSETYQGITEATRDKGALTLSGTKIRGVTSDGEARFTLRLTKRINRQKTQKMAATGNLVINDDDGVSKGRLAANVRLQKTRSGVWKMTTNYTANIKRGALKGGVLSGKMVAKSK